MAVDRGRHGSLDDPPNSRLFIICGRSLTDEECRDAFGKYGDVEDIWVVKDKNTNEPKGVVYIKFAKASQAAMAMEEMNGQIVGSHPKPIKVLIANNRAEGNRKEMHEDEKFLRLFVCIPKVWTEESLREAFQQYGDIDYVNVVKDRATRESKGLGYVKFLKASHAAKALEECEKSFKAIFAEPKGSKFDKAPNPAHFSSPPGGSYGGSSSGAGSNWGYDGNSMDYSNYGGGYGGVGGGGDGGGGNSCLEMMVSQQLTQDQLYRLCDLFPGLEHCDLKFDMASGRSRSVAIVKYQNHTYANYAKEKLHNFEYPPGTRLIVKWAEENNAGFGADPNQAAQLVSTLTAALSTISQQIPAALQGQQGYTQPPQSHGNGDAGPGALSNIANTLAQAMGVLQNFSSTGAGGQATSSAMAAPAAPAAGSYHGGGATIADSQDYCSVQLPGRQQLAPSHSECLQRLFIVCNPRPPPEDILKDVFSRFGNLIDIYMLPAKNYGYAKFSDRESALKAIECLHSHEVCGNRLKVMEADPGPGEESSRKRPRQ